MNHHILSAGADSDAFSFVTYLRSWFYEGIIVPVE
jgi:hypothetical protein